LQENWKSDTPLYPHLFQLSEALTKWNREVFGNLYHRKKQLWTRIEGAQNKLAQGHNRFLVKLETRLRKELDEALDQIELHWYQKSRIEAIRDGDRNTRYYHLNTIIRRRVNRIEALQNKNRVWYSEDSSIKEMVRAFFKILYTNDSNTYTPYIIPANNFPRLSKEEMDTLSTPFTGGISRR